MADEDLPDSVRLQAFAALAGRLEADHHQLVSFLADGLAGALPDAVEVRRRGLFRSGHVVSVEVRLGSRHFELRVHPSRLEATIATVVRGVVLRHDSVAVDTWVEALLADLEQAAGESEAARAALQRLVL